LGLLVESKHHHLVALSNIIKNIPKDILEPELVEVYHFAFMFQLFPILLRCVNFTDANLKLSTLRILHMLPMSLIQEHISTIVTTYLMLADSGKIESGNSMAVRALALEMLGDLTKSVEFGILYPLKPGVLKQLVFYLDDPKRDVRRAAVACQTKLMLLKE
jgi:DNA repair/transcription protein MET18/MMS19